jgi:predicted CxxxxCH...CXXCH cytochrome family protein
MDLNLHQPPHVRDSFRRLGSRLIPSLAISSLLTGCFEPRERFDDTSRSEAARCASCHGDPTRSDDFLLNAAPPIDLWSSTDSSYPGVGAHLHHLLGSETHGPVACAECHLVPKATDDVGHADTAGPAEIVFGDLAKTGGRDPSYDFLTRRCSDTWCHRSADAGWTTPAASEDACGTCHGLPPAAPHPQAGACSGCHGEVIGPDNVFVNPALHVDGIVQYAPSDCQACHGDDTSAAPPRDVSGNVSIDFVGVGAHRVHVLGTDMSRSVACGECHVIPNAIDDPTHADGLPAEVLFAGVATARMRNPSWDSEKRTCGNTWCHSPGSAGVGASPDWTTAEGLDCSGCHGSPPPAPHPQMDNCATCHAEVISQSGTIISPELHVNGLVEQNTPSDCASCHGGQNPAPPSAVAGQVATSFSGVGAHQTHVMGTSLSRAVPCVECHQVPVNLFDPGHVDTALPAELRFSGVAVSYGAPITYEAGTCQNSYCHGAVFFDGRLSGGTLTGPSWTIVDGTQAACGSCHGLPPPLGHPAYTDCSSCHANVRPDNVSFFDPDLHVNGITETYLP